MKKIYLLCSILCICSLSFAEFPYFDDNKRYLALMLVNEHEEATFSDEIQAAYNNGFNAVYLTVRWDAIKCHNSACMTGTNINSGWNPANRYWAQVDAQVAQATALGMKVAFRIHLNSADITNFGVPAQRSKYLWGDNNYMRQPNGSEDLGGYAFRQFSLSSQPAIDSAKLFIAEVLNRYGYLENQNKFLFYAVSMGGAQELEYSGSYLLDYSTQAKNAYTTWYQSKYGTNPPFYPEEFSSTEGKKWYTFRHQKLKEFVGTVASQIKAYNSNIKFVNDYGSVFDGITQKRGTFGFKSLGVNTDGIKVNDAEDYDHRFSMDILRTNFPGKWIMNEVLTFNNIIQSNPSLYYNFINDSYLHGAKVFSVVTSADQINALASMYSQIKNQWLIPDFSPVSSAGSVSYTFDEILHANFNGNRFSTSSRNIYQEWLNAYNANPSNAKPVNIYYNDDELNNCTTPAAPSLTASPSTIASGASSTLSASGCSGGTITWSDNLGTGTSKSVSPTATKTYSATCSINGCTSASTNVVVNVTPPSGGGCLVDKVRLQFRSPADCCYERLVGAKIQGSNNGTSWTDLYTFTGNGNGSFQEFTFTNSTSYNSVRFVASNTGWGELNEIEFYNGTTKLTGTAFGTDNFALAFDGNTSTQWHAPTTPGPNNYAGLNLTGCSGTSCSAPSLTASPATITSGSSSTLTATGCSGTVTWSNGLGTGTSKSVSPTSTTTYTATCTIGSCVSSAASVTVTVNPPSGTGCVPDKVKLQFRESGQCCMDRLPGAKIQGSNNGSTWTDLYTFSSNGTGSWQEFTFSNTTSYTSVRFVASATGWGELHELEFYNGTTKLSGTAFGTDNYALAFDGNTATQWHAPTTPGPNNYAGLNLTGCTGTSCSAPSLTASPSSITSGSSSTLTASGCSGTVTWSNGLGTGNSKTVSPTSTTTYTATCTIGSCVSSAGSVTVNVTPPSGTGCTINKVRFQFRQSGECCMDRLPGAKIQGSNNGTTWTDLYTFTTNGTGSWQEFTFSNTTAYSSVRFQASSTGWGELYELEFYKGTAKLTGTPFGVGNYANAFDGNLSTDWQVSSNPGTNNYAGLNNLGNCSGSPVVLDMTDPGAINNKLQLLVSPNPSNGVFNAGFYLQRGKKATIVINDLQGRTIYRQAITGNGQHNEKIYLVNKSSGTFIMRLETSTGVEVRKINIAR